MEMYSAALQRYMQIGRRGTTNMSIAAFVCERANKQLLEWKL
jgi:hypothetical protein